MAQKVSSGMNKQMVVISTQNAGQYTYIEGEENGVSIWLASNQLEVSPGDTIQYRAGQAMINFHSKTLDKTFDQIIFTDAVQVLGKKGNVNSAFSDGQNSTIADLYTSQSASNPHMTTPDKTMSMTAQPVTAEISVQKMEGGYSVEELYAKRNELNGQAVAVRGTVVKFLSGIMGKNWIHLQDGSGSAGTNDLTITTQEEAKVGDTVICKGKLTADKDLGQGYVYTVILEDASLTSE
ncbi:MAG: hypothetical protein HQM11_10495 [SAR324 cluster bacterium]|nr:hypothetical protein [SAR324 cluster bacterium]